MFADECYWRDLVAFTWNLRTCEGREQIRAMLRATLAAARPKKFVVEDFQIPIGDTETWFSFETAVGRGIGHLRLKDGKCWTLLTTLRELKGFEEKRGAAPAAGDLGIAQQPYCVIVGGGQGGIGLAARLKRIGVPAIVIEKNRRAGDSWRKRYQSLVLHDPVWYDHMPYLPFPEHWPVFSPKDRIGDWLEMYAKVMELDYWSATECVGAKYDSEKSVWEVKVKRDQTLLTLKPKHLILATGMSGVPNVPKIAGAASFQGVQCHSSRHQGGEGWQGKECVVVGSGTSAHDICADLWEHGAHVTMIQRAPAIVVRSATLMDLAWGKLYSEAALEAGITTDLADLSVASVPFKVLPELQKPIYEEIAKRDADLYEGLEKAGFQFDFGADGSGIHSTYLRRGAGYYIEVGASQMIIEGKVKLARGSLARINEKSVQLENHVALPADLIVYATGYGSMNGWAAQLISQEVAERVGICWGLGSGTKNDPGPWEGELRNMWKPTAQPGLWFHGGNLMQSRHYSLYLALQLKARLEGISTPVF